MAIPFNPVTAIANLVDKGIDKIWMDKGEKARLEFSREELRTEMKLMLKSKAMSHDIEKLELEFRESQAQRDYAHEQFGTASVLKTFFAGRLILVGRASIRWVITVVSMWFTYKIIDLVLTEEMIASLARGDVNASTVWLVSLIVVLVVGTPMFYVAGVSIEKLLKSRGVI